MNGRKKSAPPSLDDATIMSALNEEWKSPAQIRMHANLPCWTSVLAIALHQLADRGMIERKSEEIDVRKQSGARLVKKRYRRIQLEF